MNNKQVVHSFSSPPSWTLARYARFLVDRGSAVVRSETNVPKGLWKNWSTSNGDLVLSLSETGQLVITQQDVCLENILLSSCTRDKLKILAKGDSMLFAVKLKNDVRRFRIMFAEIDNRSLSSEQACLECAAAMRSFFPVRTLNQMGNSLKNTDSTTLLTPGSSSGHPQKKVEGPISLNQLVELLTSGDLTTLPCAYHAGSYKMVPKLEINAFSRLIKWCLLDPDFPEFVQKVETELKRISEEN